MKPSVLLKGYDRIDWKSQADFGACGTHGPETGDRTRDSACDGCYQVPKALELGSLFGGEYAVRVRGSKPPPEKGVRVVAQMCYF